MFKMRKRAAIAGDGSDDDVVMRAPRTSIPSAKVRDGDGAGGEDSDEETYEEESGSGEDEDFEPGPRRRRRGRGPATSGEDGGRGVGVDGDVEAIPASDFSLDDDRARFKAGTLKHEVFKMLEAAWPKMMDANELYEMGSAAGVNVGKNKTVLASGLSHDKCFVRVPGTKNKWALRAHVGYPAGKNGGDEKSGPREKRSRPSKPRSGLAALLDSMDSDQKASILAWSDKLKQNASDLKKAKGSGEKAKNALEKATKALEEFEASPPSEISAAHLSAKSADDILCEPEAPSDRLRAEFSEYTGPNDRKFFVAWKKSVEEEKARIKSAQDSYVAMRKKEIREASTKMNKKREQLVSAVTRAQTQLNLAQGTIERAEFITEITRERIELLKEKAAAEDEDTKNAVNEKIAALDTKVTELYGQKMAALENQIEREKLKLMAKGDRDAERARLTEEKSRLKEEEKAERAKQREIEKAEKEKAKAEEKAAKERAARYPLDDDILAIELAEEAKEAGVPLETLLRPIPKAMPLPNGQVIAEEAFVAEFISVFGAGLQAPEGLTNVEAINAVLENNQKSRSTLAELYMSILYEALSPAASGPGRFIARLNRIVNNFNWPEVTRMLILHGGESAHGKPAVEVAQKLANTTWDNLSNADHLVLLRALADLALEGDICRDIITSRMQQADIFRSERHEARLKAVANRRIVEKAEKEERRRERERLAEEKRAAKAAAEAAKAVSGEQADTVMEDVSEPKSEHIFGQTTTGETDEERLQREAMEEEARRRLEIDEKRSRDREQKRAAEDAACQVRARPLGMDRHLTTYWWNFGGRKDGIYVQSFDGNWGIYNSQAAVDALVNALNTKGTRENALKKQLEKRKITIADCFKAMNESQEERDARFAASLEGGERRSVRSRFAPSSDAYVATRPAAYLSCDEGSVLTAARKCMDTMCINAERIGLETDVDWRTFRNKLKNAPESFIAEQLLLLEEKYFECQVKEFRIAAEREKIEREKQPQAPDELSKATLEALVLKHTGKDMSSWKLARRKLAALLPPEVVSEAVEERRRQQVDSDDEDDEEDEDGEVDESWNNDENVPEDTGDITIWKGTLQRPNFIEYLNPEKRFPVVRIAYAAATLLDATCAFSEEIAHRRELRAKETK
ncbi:hypothetical protein BE221DRAFT_190948 [Ostreococcus tauri]|uniref:WHIM2 domain-containing protein n=1 Tax=Ostreococcus tauri TaxID=70448 RepID=A0A1Y5IKA6_OSTTA|nr:hypothetical protein BE221DRAFT_190948 [Ostreococcus tauri]